MGSRGIHRFRIYSKLLILVCRNKNQKTCILTDMAVSADGNVTQKEAEEKIKYKSSCTTNVKYVM